MLRYFQFLRLHARRKSRRALQCTRIAQWAMSAIHVLRGFGNLPLSGTVTMHPLLPLHEGMVMFIVFLTSI